MAMSRGGEAEGASGWPRPRDGCAFPQGLGQGLDLYRFAQVIIHSYGQVFFSVTGKGISG